MSPAEADRWFQRGNAALRQGDASGAAAAYEQAVGLSPSHADAWLNLGTAYRRLERIEEAAACARRVLDLRPDDPRALNNLANALSAEGRLEEASRCYRRAVELRPDDAEAWWNLVSQQPLNDGSADSEALFARLSAQAQAPDRPALREQSTLLFAYGKALEARGEPERAFDSLIRANALHRSSLQFDIAAAERRAAAIAERFDVALFAQLGPGGSPSQTPVFVVGMPRSGTTLVEQILSAHPEVHGAGETGLFPSALSRMRTARGTAFPFWAGEIAAGDLEELARAYLGAIESRGDGKERITDKTIASFELLGLIHLCLPNARIVHVRRDPRDVCVSCFATRFSAGHDYAYDLGELARYWRLYDRLMSHWRRVLPAGRILELDYEDLVEDLEGGARRLTAHLGLDWDEACLRFHDSSRVVGTASFAQVRRPIYRDSIGRWRRFEARLAPLIEALGET